MTISENENIALLELTKPTLKRPPLYRVLLINDDYTPMDFVVKVLKHFFFMGEEKAVHIMMQVHSVGKAVCGVYTRDVAETKVKQVTEYAEQHEYPLQCGMEPECD